MGLMDWLFGPPRQPSNLEEIHSAAQRHRDRDAAETRAYEARIAHVSRMTVAGGYSEPTWQHTIRIGPPPETHKRRMARLIARRERSGR